MNESIIRTHEILKYDGTSLVRTTDSIAEEFPLTIHIDGEEFATMVCSPNHFEELVIGFLAAEGIIHFYEDIHQLSIDRGRGFAYVSLKIKKNITKEMYTKRFIGSCCGKSRQFYFHNDARTAKTITSKMTIKIEQCFQLMKMMQKKSIDFKETGGVHNAALCTVDQLVLSRTDIGRHNALDKIYGHCILQKIPRVDKVVAFSGRVSSEVLLKVAKIGIGIVLSKSAPTTLAIELAQDLGITIVGFIRNNQLNIYSHPERILV